MRYTTIIFDLGGTLLGYTECSVVKAFVGSYQESGLRVDHARIKELLHSLRGVAPERENPSPVYSPQDLGLLRTQASGSDWVRAYGPSSVRVVSRRLARCFHRMKFDALFDDAKPVLQNLQARGLNLGVLSNFTPDCEGLLQNLGIYDYFDFLVISSMVGVEKPEPIIFELAVEAAGCAKEQILYVGDSIFQDAEGASKAGLDVILINRSSKYPDTHFHVIGSLLELEDFLTSKFSAVRALSSTLSILQK